MDTQSVATILAWLYSGGGASTATFYLMEKWPWLVRQLAKLQSEHKRYASWFITTLLVAVPFAVAVLFGYEPSPGMGQGWIERLVPMILLAITVGQGIHARLVLSKK